MSTIPEIPPKSLPEMTGRQIELWEQLFSAVEPDTVSPLQFPLVVELTRSIAKGEWIHDQIVKYQDSPETEAVGEHMRMMNLLFLMAGREANIQNTLYTKLRWHVASQHDKNPATAKPANEMNEPWNVTDLELKAG